jgi:hypothetical protein
VDKSPGVAIKNELMNIINEEIIKFLNNATHERIEYFKRRRNPHIYLHGALQP